MSHKIKLDDLRAAVDSAYEEYKSIDKGAVDARVQGKVSEDTFGITVMLTDGTTINKGDTEAIGALGDIASLAVHSMLLQQLGVKELIKKAGKTSSHTLRKMDLPMSPHGVRAVSALEPNGDSDGKYDLVINNIVDMMGSAPVLDDALYQKLMADVASADEENKLAEAEYTLYDEPQASMGIYARLQALGVNTQQLATFGATIAADGRNPINNAVVYDGTLSAPLVTIAAIHGNPTRNRRWMLKSGVPAVFSFAGLVLAIMPGVGAIAAYAPAVGKHGRTKKGARAVRYITAAMGYNVFGSTPVEVVK